MTATRTEPATSEAGRPEAAFPARRDVPLVPVASMAGRALVTVIAIMTFLASLAAGAAILIVAASGAWQQGVAREMTIQVRPISGHDLDAEVAKAVGIARDTPGVGEVVAMGKEEAEKLLEPWLGAGLDLHELPIPRLVVVKLASGVRPDLASLRKTLAERVAGATLDDHQLWLSRLATMADTVAAMAVLVFVLVLTAMGVAVAFATRGVMAGNREIIGVLHFVGAEDRFIARQFQHHFLRLGLKGGIVGGGCASAAFLLASVATNALPDTPGADQVHALFGAFSLGPAGYLAIAAIAVGIGIATGSVSRGIVFRQLRGLR